MNVSLPSGNPTELPEHIRGHYQLQESTMTLEEGLAEYYRVNPGLDDPKNIENSESALWFRRHDTTHVIFGTHTGDLNEGCNDYYTLFGVELSFWAYLRGYAKTEQSKGITAYYVKWDTLRMLWMTLVLTLPVRRLAKAMHKKWPWHPTQEMYQTPLAKLRAEYGIQVAHPHAMWAAR
jgi:hypothetical protein